MYNKKGRGFTLIELLIVIAIIAILAAIAIPNFLAAQVRSKVARVKGEMRSMAAALEAYYVDSNTYPLMVNDYGTITMAGLLHVHNAITTPVAYITRQPEDLFSYGQDYYFRPMGRYYCYQNWDLYYKSDPVAYGYGYRLYGAWKLWAAGPFRNRATWTILYDPSNGTVSNGCIARTQKSAEGLWVP